MPVASGLGKPSRSPKDGTSQLRHLLLRKRLTRHGPFSCHSTFSLLCAEARGVRSKSPRQAGQATRRTSGRPGQRLGMVQAHQPGLPGALPRPGVLLLRVHGLRGVPGGPRPAPRASRAAGAIAPAARAGREASEAACARRGVRLGGEGLEEKRGAGWFSKRKKARNTCTSIDPIHRSRKSKFPSFLGSWNPL